MTSLVVLVPKRRGGPLAVYYQELKGPRPRPVSLIELDAAGHTVGTLREAPESEPCRLPVTRGAVVARGGGLDGAPFRISARDEGPHPSATIETSFASDGQVPFSEVPLSTPNVDEFEARVAAACGANPYAVVYGRL